MPPQRRRKAVICLPPDNPDAMTELVPMAVDALAEREEAEMADDLIPKYDHLFEGRPYIVIEITGEVDNDNVEVLLETGNGFDQPTALNFLKDVIKSAEEN